MCPTTSRCVLSKNPFRERLLTDLFTAYYAARSNKRNTYTQVRFERDLTENLLSLYDDIVSRRYKLGRSMCFIIDRPVKREVFAASFRDRIVHHLLYQYLLPIFEPQFIYDSYSCRVGKGTLFGIGRLEHHIRSVSDNYRKKCWVLKLDLSGYFMSIDRQRLYDIIMMELHRQKLDCASRREEYLTMAYLLKLVIFNDPTQGCYVKGSRSDWNGLPATKSLFHTREGCGLPIGNLTSQLFSNIYLNGLDQFVKRELKCRHYGRYVDDFYFVDTDRQRLLSYIPRVSDYLENNLFLHLHPKKVFLQTQDKGVPFLGCVLKNGNRYISSRGKRLMMEHFADAFINEDNPYQIMALVNAYQGYLSKLDGIECPV